MTYDEALNIITANISAVVSPSKHKAADKAILDYAKALLRDEEFGTSWADAQGWAPSAKALYDKISSITDNEFVSPLSQEEDGTVKWQGQLAENTTIDSDEYDLVFEVGGVSALNIGSRALTVGSLKVVDWELAYYNDSDGNPMFRNRNIYTSVGEHIADFENGKLYDYSLVPSISWAENGEERQLIDGDGDKSIDWLMRILWAKDLVDNVDFSGSDGKSVLLLSSTTKAFVLPRMTTVQKNAIPTPLGGSKVFDTTIGKECVYGLTGWETILSV